MDASRIVGAQQTHKEKARGRETIPYQDGANSLGCA